MGNPGPSTAHTTVVELRQLTPDDVRMRQMVAKSVKAFPPEYDLMRSYFDSTLVEMTFADLPIRGDSFTLNVVIRGLYRRGAWHYFEAEVFKITRRTVRSPLETDSYGFVNGMISFGGGAGPYRQAYAWVRRPMIQALQTGEYQEGNLSARRERFVRVSAERTKKKFVVKSGTIVQAYRSDDGRRIIVTNPQSTGIFYAMRETDAYEQMQSLRGGEHPNLLHFDYTALDRHGQRHQLSFDGQTFKFDDEVFAPMTVPAEFEYISL